MEISGAVDTSAEYNLLYEYVKRFLIEKIVISFIGPALIDNCIEIQKHFTRDSLLCSIFVEPKMYHEFIHETHFHKPNLIVMFNAGLWGYDSWIPTLRAFTLLKNVSILVTSYTMEEAEDDFDVVESVCGPQSLIWVWEPEINPCRSETIIERINALAGRTYFDNGVWQCFTIIN